ncbi:SH3 domain-containing protein [Lysinibacillus xylanilyticus]|uniref:SH3 domain-containing protein n=1 Tax=Lysinibacillus xylanilyticus TaxID=582475 RepID=A0ABT4EYS3_9BACI|nr:SH3 domain-containing protein [Lysinibacillus xylanilyticus]MCY9549436.1 SH3 domain-containing protein [Lysinibacillus xylanilyticus]
MKKILKPLISVIAIGALSLSINIDKNVLANNIVNTCDYDSASKGNPDFSTMNCLLTETALIYDVPPEIVKAIAEGESGNWRHFDKNGEAIVTADNGIGIMQITNQAGYNQDRLKSDIVYNIQAGVETLDKMFKRKDLPSINGGERDVLEHWYFAIMAYNGTKPVNSPIVQATGKRNANAYQERILRIIEKLELIDLTELPFSREHFQYESNSKENIKFSAMNYDFDLSLNKSKYFFETNQKVSATTNVTLRTRPTTDSPSMGTLREGEVVTITGPFVYEEVSTKKNHFVWYPVKRSDGTKGYVASSYLNYSASTPTTPVTTTQDYSAYAKKFADFSTTAWWRDDMIWAIDRGLISGYGNVWNAKTKKYETQLQPNTQLTEAHFLTIFFRYAQKDELASVKNTSSWNKSGLYNMAKKYKMPVLANEESTASKGLADKGISRGKLAQLMASYHSGKTVSQNDAIQFFMDNGITTATSIGGYNPDQILTRSQISAFIQRYESFVSKQK